jgi:hypothetical protein
MAERVDPRTTGSEFDGIGSYELRPDPEVRRHSEGGKKQEELASGTQVDPRKDYSEFDGIGSSG